MLKFIHLTDTHLLPRGGANWGLDPAWRLRAAIDSINGEHGDAEFCLITGDLTHFGQPAAYEVLREQIERLSMPVRLVLGNHDDRRNFQKAFSEVPADENGFVQYWFRMPFATGVVLDTNEPNHHSGAFCHLRAMWLRKALEETDGTPVVIFMHHPPFEVGMPCMDQYSLLDTRLFWEQVDPVKERVRHIFFGHIHRPIAGSVNGIPFSTLRGTNHQVALDLESFPKIVGSHEPAQYCVTLMDATRVVVHFHDYLDRSPRFVMDGSVELADRAAAQQHEST